jgi:capsular exopolysaccharide synthesis family protein
MHTSNDQTTLANGDEFAKQFAMSDYGHMDTFHEGQLSTGPNGTELDTQWAGGDLPFPEADELFRGIYTRAGTGFRSEVLAVSSAVAGEGKTTVSIGLAIAMAQDFPDRRVLLVETDVQRAVLADDFGTEPTPGLLECLISHEPLQVGCRPTFLPNLHIVPVGAPTTTGRPLRSSRMAAIVDAMRQTYDVIILDLPALLTNSDAVLLTDLADGVICVVRAGVTPAGLVNRAIEQIEDGKLRGIVLNGSRSSVPNWLRRLSGI